MKSIFFLKNCSTCKKIMAMFDLSGWELREIKTDPITEKELAEMYALTGSYEQLFSKRSTQIKIENINVKNLDESNFKKLLLQHYSFLKRPVFVTENQIFVGNESKNIEELQHYFNIKE